MRSVQKSIFQSGGKTPSEAVRENIESAGIWQLDPIYLSSSCYLLKRKKEKSSVCPFQEVLFVIIVHASLYFAESFCKVTHYFINVI